MTDKDKIKLAIECLTDAPMYLHAGTRYMEPGEEKEEIQELVHLFLLI